MARKFPSYTLKELEFVLAQQNDGRVSYPSEVIRQFAEEVADRKAGRSTARVTPQIPAAMQR